MTVNANGYEFYRSDGETQVSVPKGAINYQFSIPLIGQNATPYGDSVAQSQVHMLENFSHVDPPLNAMKGQLWSQYDPTMEDDGKHMTLRVAKIETGVSTSVDNWMELLSPYSNLGDQGLDLGSVDYSFARVIYANHFVARGGDFDDSTSDENGTFHGTAIRAKYADLAERFHADDYYEEGTILRLGGKYEVTATADSGDVDVLGVVSRRPGLMMNADAGDNETHPYVALAGRVPVRIIGSVKKGDRIVSSPITGVAKAVAKDELLQYNVYQIIGRALEDSVGTEESLVMVVVGAK